MNDLSVVARYEIAKRYVQSYSAAPKWGKPRILDQVVKGRGWYRNHARQQLAARQAELSGRAAATVAAIDRRKLLRFGEGVAAGVHRFG